MKAIKSANIRSALPYLGGSPDHEERFKHLTILFLSPPLILLIILGILPLLYAFYLSLHNADLFSTGEFIWFANYQNLLSEPEFHMSIYRGGLFAVSVIFLTIVLGLLIALALNQYRGFGSSLLRTSMIFPYLVPLIALRFMWGWLLNPSGLFVYILEELRIITEQISLFGHPDTAFPLLVFVTSWKYVGFAVILFLARLQSIDSSLYETAKMNGANRFHMFKDITLPSLWSVILLVGLLRFIWMFNHFALIWMFTRGGPLSSTTTLPVFIYKRAFISRDLGEASAAAVLLFLILVVFAIIYFVTLRPSEEIETGR